MNEWILTRKRCICMYLYFTAFNTFHEKVYALIALSLPIIHAALILKFKNFQEKTIRILILIALLDGAEIGNPDVFNGNMHFQTFYGFIQRYF